MQKSILDLYDDSTLFTDVFNPKLPIAENDLPPVMREVVKTSPKSRKVPAVLASVPALATIATRIRLWYYHDPQMPNSINVQEYVVGVQSSGKSFAARISDMIMRETFDPIDMQELQKEQAYREKRKVAPNKDMKETEPKVRVHQVPANISIGKFIKRAQSFFDIYGDYLSLYMHTQELSQLSNSRKNTYSDLSTLLRTGYDLGAKFGQDYLSDNSFSANPDILINSLLLCTPNALEEYFNKRAIEGGDITRSIIIELSNDAELDDELFKPYTDEQMASIRNFLKKMMADQYSEDGALQPTKTLNTKFLDPECKKFNYRKREEYEKSGNEAIDVFRRRSSVSAFRITCLIYYMYSLDGGFDPCSADEDSHDSEEASKKKTKARRLCKKIYNWLAEYILTGLMYRFSSAYNELNGSRHTRNHHQPSLFDLLPNVFTRGELYSKVAELQLSKAPRKFLSDWRKRNYIKEIGEDKFEKIK